MLTPIGTYNGVAVCKCVENCDFKASWVAAGRPTHFDSEMVLNRDYEGIVTDGLIMNLDAGFTPSYPKNGTTWYDLGGANNGTLTNGPTFSSSNGGLFELDGTNDEITLSNNTNSVFKPS